MISLLISLAMADPCGMVPPIWTGSGPPDVGIERTGLQQTYVFHQDGVQTIAIRPGFTGDVEQFGMLVPLPAVPALRKIDDRTFDHLAAAVDPPIVEFRPPLPRRRGTVQKSAGRPQAKLPQPVAVLKTEAVGMYEVAVLEAGSAASLKRWMEANSFRYPTGMDQTVEEYVDAGWLFVAIKTRMGDKEAVSAKPGMREAHHGLKQRFNGFVQGMAFRFRTEEAVIPMRLSTFNGDDTHNRVYLLTNQGVRLDQISTSVVRRQVDGPTLYDNMTKPLKVAGGMSTQVRDQERLSPVPHNGAAKDLMGGDLLSITTGNLDLPFEMQEKAMLNIAESLNLRGADIDRLHDVVIKESRDEALGPALANINELTLTLIDGEFPSELLSTQNLTWTPYTMPAARNNQTSFSVQPKPVYTY